MTSRRGMKLREGDVFSIPVDENRVGYGQIVDTYGSSGDHFYFAIFEGVYQRADTPDLDAVLAEPVVLLALSMDALLVHDRWQVVGNSEVDDGRIPWPAYKEGVSPPGSFEVVDTTGQLRRPASDDEVARLPFRSIVAPIRVEKAFRALIGSEPWDAAYETLRPVVDELTSRALLPG